MTLDRIVSRNALRFPDKSAVICGSRAYSWQQFDGRINRLAHAFRQAGIQPGDRIAVLLSNCAEYLEIYFACARSGAIAVPLNYRLTDKDFAQILAHAEPSLLVFGGEYINVVNALKSAGALPDACWALADRSLALDFTAYEQQVQDAPADVFVPEGSDQDTLAIFFTSGTTGLPKGAMVSSANLEMNGYNQVIADAAVADDVNLVATPIYHIGAVFMAVSYMMLSCTQVVLPRFEPRLWLQLLQQSRATVSLLIPTMINAVLNDGALKKHDLSSLRLVFYGGGPMPVAVLEKAIAHLGCSFTQGYGLTETLEATFLVASDHVTDGDELQQKRLGSAGREALGADVRIVDEKGQDLPGGEVGEILVRSRSVISGYWRMPEETAQAIRDGWFFTGDMGYLDDARYLFVVDRKKDMVVSGGVNIYTKEIEGVLYAHPDILEAAVIALPDEEWGEVVTAIVVASAGKKLEEQAIIEYCKEHMAGFKKPRKVFFLAELPKNPSGKILKRELRAQFSTG